MRPWGSRVRDRMWPRGKRLGPRECPVARGVELEGGIAGRGQHRVPCRIGEIEWLVMTLKVGLQRIDRLETDVDIAAAVEIRPAPASAQGPNESGLVGLELDGVTVRLGTAAWRIRIVDAKAAPNQRVRHGLLPLKTRIAVRTKPVLDEGRSHEKAGCVLLSPWLSSS